MAHTLRNKRAWEGTIEAAKRMRTYGPTLYDIHKAWSSGGKFKYAKQRTNRKYRNSDVSAGVWSYGGSNPQRYMRCRGAFVPLKFRTNLIWNHAYVETDADGFAVYTIKGNTLYYPSSLVNAKPTGASTLTYLYNRYKVLASKIFIEVVNNDTDDALYVVVMPSKSPDMVGVANKQAVFGLPGAKNMTISSQSGGGVITAYARTTDVCNFKFCDDVNFTAALGADPGTLWYWHIYIFNLDGAAMAAEIRYKVVYDAILYDPNNDSQGV